MYKVIEKWQEIWIARNKSGALYAYRQEPKRMGEAFVYMPSEALNGVIRLDDMNFKQVTWENSPLCLKDKHKVDKKAIRGNLLPF